VEHTHTKRKRWGEVKFLEKYWSELLLVVLVIVFAISFFIPLFVGLARGMWHWALTEAVTLQF
jgi:hypothetical protein